MKESEDDSDYLRYKEMEAIKRHIHVLLANETFLSLDESYRLSRKIFNIFMASDIPDDEYIKTYKGKEVKTE